MNRKIAAILALQAFLIIMLFWMLVFYGKDEYEAYTSDAEEEIETPSLVSTNAGATIVTLSAQTQAQSDIRTTPLQAGKHRNTLASFGTVVAIDPLIELRTRYLAASAEANVVRATLLGSRQEYERVRKLSDRLVEQAVRYQSGRGALGGCRNRSRQHTRQHAPAMGRATDPTGHGTASERRARTPAAIPRCAAADHTPVRQYYAEAWRHAHGHACDRPRQSGNGTIYFGIAAYRQQHSRQDLFLPCPGR